MEANAKELYNCIAGACTGGPIPYSRYIDLALYHPRFGYYQRPEARVGRTWTRDFYTAESLGPVFAQLVVDASVRLLGEDNAAATDFFEIGAEPGGTLLQHAPGHPFRSETTVGIGEPPDPKGRAVVFANEWLDALPFHRLIVAGGQWRERGVVCDGHRLTEVLLDTFSEPVAAACGRLPAPPAEGYQLDWPLAAEAALRRLVARPWDGLLLLFDYGRSWHTLCTELPQGSARTYRHHQQGAELLATPGAADITCDLCWDPLEAILREHGFDPVALQSQEAFFVHHASRAAERIIQSTAGTFSEARQTLMELIHPGHMGRRFQVLHARRPSA